MNDLNEIKEILFSKKFIKDSEHYPETKVLLVKGGTKNGLEIGLSNYCSEEYAKEILVYLNIKVLKAKIDAFKAVRDDLLPQGIEEAIEYYEKELKDN